MSDWKGMLQELMSDESDTMSAWEIEFIESLDKQQRGEDWAPSDKQLFVLEKIWRKVFA